jgi:hypothetical protein
VLATTGFKALWPSLGYVGSAIVVGVLSLAVAVAGLISLRETHGIDLDFEESDDPELPKATAVG